MLVFPLFPIVDGKCGCGKEDCDPRNAGKHPRVYGWQQGAPVEDGEPYGVVTGPASGIFVIDIDQKDGKDGFAAWDVLAQGRETSTLAVRTGSGGLHLYYRWPADQPISSSQSYLGLGIDVRGAGGYVVGPGSPHKSGGTYEIVHDVPVAPAPAWLLEALRRAPAHRAAGDNAPKPIDIETDKGKDRMRRYASDLQKAQPSIQGQNGSKALWMVALLGVRTYELPLDTCAALIEEHFNPRCEPPWSAREVMHKLEDARDRSDEPCGRVVPETWEQTVSEWCKPAALKGLAPPAASEAGYSYVVGTTAASERKKICVSDVTQVLKSHEDWIDVLRYDEFAERIIALRPPMQLNAETNGLNDNDVVLVRMWLQANGLDAPKEEVWDAIQATAKANSYHPVREYLNSLPDVPEDSWGLLEKLADVVGASESRAGEYFAKTLIASVRRIQKPGTKVDTLLLLVGPQSYKKSTLVVALYGVDYVLPQVPDLNNKDASEALKGRWAAEFAELSTLSKSDQNRAKDYLSRLVDDYRPSYGKGNIRRPRYTVFWGTTNDEHSLKDPTGSRRFWPVEVNKRIDIEWVLEHRDALWAEAKARAEAGEAHWFENDLELEAEKSEHQERDPWHDQVGSLVAQFAKEVDGRRCIWADIIWEKLGGELKDFDDAKQKRISRCLTQWGLTRWGKRSVRPGYRPRVWVVPNDPQLAHRPRADIPNLN